MEKIFLENESADESRQNLRTSLSFENSAAAQTRSSELQIETREEFETRMRRLVQISDDQKTIKLWLIQKSKHTKRAYNRIANELVQFFESTRKTFATAQAEDLLIFCSMKDSCNKATVQQRGAIVKSIFAFAHAMGRINTNPSLLVKFKRPENKIAARNLMEVEVFALIGACEPGRDRALISLLYSSGRKRSEIINLNWADLLERSDGSIKVSIHGKRDKKREVVVSKSVWQPLKDMKSEDSKASEAVFGSTYGGEWKRISESRLIQIVQAAAIKAGIVRKISPHFLRHAHATHALNRGASLKLIQETLGHASIEMTSRYTHSNPNESNGDYVEI